MKARPKIIAISGSTKFIAQMAIKAWELERDEKCITLGCHLLPTWYCQVADHFAEAQGVAEAMDELHLRKIDLADELFVVNIDGYIGESTRREIEYATAAGKPVRYEYPNTQTFTPAASGSGPRSSESVPPSGHASALRTPNAAGVKKGNGQ